MSQDTETVNETPKLYTAQQLARLITNKAEAARFTGRSWVLIHNVLTGKQEPKESTLADMTAYVNSKAGGND